MRGGGGGGGGGGGVLKVSKFCVVGLGSRSQCLGFRV